jgi:hypothetical protein
MTVTMNSPVKMMTEFALMASMVFFLYEDRFDISAEKARPRLYFTSALAAQLLCLVSGLSGIAGYFSGAVTNSELVIESLFCITVFFYALARTGAFCGAGGKPGAAGEEAADGETAPAADPDADDTAAGATAADGETAVAEGTDAAPSDPDAPAADPDAPGDA